MVKTCYCACPPGQPACMLRLLPAPGYIWTIGSSDIDDFLRKNREKPTAIQLGWQCPECKTIYAPSVKSCDCAKGMNHVD